MPQSANCARRGYFPTSVVEEAIRGLTARWLASARKWRPQRNAREEGHRSFCAEKVSSKILMIFTRQLATLIDSGCIAEKLERSGAKQERAR